MLTFSKWIGSVKKEFSIAIGKTKNSMATIHVDASLLIYHQELRILSLVSWFFLFHKKCLLLRWAFQIENKVFWKTFLRWVRTSANFEEVPWLNQDTKGVCGYSQNRKFDAESLDSRRTYLFDTICSPCSIRFGPLRSFISGLRLKQFPKLFYSQNSRVPETLVFQELFSQRKVFNLLKWL